MSDKKIGEIKHYYNKIGVAVIHVLDTIKVGDRLKISGHDHEFEQELGSMQIEHEKINSAKKGDDVGIKVDQPVKEGDEIYSVE